MNIKTIPFKEIRRMRGLILMGYTVNEVAEIIKCSRSSVLKYTKAERKRLVDNQ